MSDEEHDARHDLLVYIQTKLEDYQWSTVKAFHDQVDSLPLTYTLYYYHDTIMT